MRSSIKTAGIITLIFLVLYIAGVRFCESMPGKGGNCKHPIVIVFPLIQLVGIPNLLLVKLSDALAK